MNESVSCLPLILFAQKLKSQILALAHNLVLARMTGARARLRARLETISKISIGYDLLDWAII